MLDTTLLIVPAAYFLGSISSAVIICRLFNLTDPRTVGSGNPGATNVLRHGGKKAAALTLFFDVLKGFLPVFAALLLNATPWILSATALAAFLGHLYSIFLKFRGGKGVATAFGALSGISWEAAAFMLITWIAGALLTRYSSVGALSAALGAPFYVWFFTHSPAYTLTTILISALLYWKHRSNIRNLLDGTEGRFGKA